MADYQKSKEQNQYAKNSAGIDVFIHDAESGQRGYWCLGCGEELIAVKYSDINHKSFFRHQARNIEFERKCSFSNESYRHTLAMDILQRTKRIKVPNIYKYSIDGAKAILLEESKYVEAHSVKAELTFYEDDEGNVKWGKNPEIDNKNLLIRPDITFFDIHEVPILLIEIVATHKLDDEKKAKIRRLGIDTIQIIIPKDSPENIAKSLETSKNTKWIFNNAEQNTENIHLSPGDAEGVLPFDAIEMGFFKESFACRENQIRNLIRSITKCLGSEHYCESERGFRSELSRVAENTIRNQNRLDDLREQHRRKGQERHRDSLKTIAEEESIFAEIERGELRGIRENFNHAKRRQESNFNELESRYLSKGAELEGRRNQIRNNITREEQFIEEHTGIGNTQITIREATARVQNEIDRLERSRIEITRRFDEYGKSEQFRYSAEFGNIRRTIDSLPDDFRRKEEEVARRLESEETALRSAIGRSERAITINPEKYRTRTIQLFEGTNLERSQLPERFTKLFEGRTILNDWNAKQNTLNRNRAALECFNSGTYKKWN